MAQASAGQMEICFSSTTESYLLKRKRSEEHEPRARKTRCTRPERERSNQELEDWTVKIKLQLMNDFLSEEIKASEAFLKVDQRKLGTLGLQAWYDRFIEKKKKVLREKQEELVKLQGILKLFSEIDTNTSLTSKLRASSNLTPQNTTDWKPVILTENNITHYGRLLGIEQLLEMLEEQKADIRDRIRKTGVEELLREV